MDNFNYIDGYKRSRGEWAIDYLKRILETENGLSVLEKMSVAEIAAKIECPKSTVADAIRNHKEKILNDKRVKKHITEKMARDIFRRINLIDNEIKELKKILKGY